jgi:beta-glucosidase
VPFPAKYPTMNSSWLKIGPEALYWGPRNVAKVWNASDIYITENGCSATDVPAADGIVYDTDRIMFLRKRNCSARRPRACQCAAISIGA